MTGPAPTLWVALRGWDRDAQRAVFQVFNLSMHALTMAAYLATGAISAEAARLFLVVAPAMLAPQAARGEPIDVPVIVGGSVVLFSLVLIRMEGLLRALATALAKQRRTEKRLREAEARYRTLVEHAPEAIVVLDMDLGHFVECNENAVRFFKMTRENLLRSGPQTITPPFQSDGSPSFGVAR